jgi:hypothetical protein
MPASRHAIELAKRAVELDVAKDYIEAAREYRAAATALERDADADGDRGLAAKAKEYRERARELDDLAAGGVGETTRANANGANGARADAKPHDSGGSSTLAGAAAVGAVAGFCVLGPITGVVAAGAMAYGTTRKDSVGMFSRTAGRAAASTYSSLKRWNKDYKITEKATRAVVTTGKAVKKLDDDYKITEKTSKAVAATGRAAVDFNEKHQVSRRVGEGVSSGLDAVTAAVGAKTSTTKNSDSIAK